MKRGWAICPAGHWDPATAADRVRIDASGVPPASTALRGEHGTEFLLDLGGPTTLGDGDGIILDDGSVIAIVGGVACNRNRHDHDHDH